MTTKNRYEYTDKVVKSLIKRYTRLFGNAKSDLLNMDEINVLGYAKTLYRKAEKITEEAFLLIAQKAYHDFVSEEKRKIDKQWVTDKLSDYDPVTMYVYLHEVDRKRAKFEEAVIASANRAKEVDKGLRLWSMMVKQYADEITDEAVLEAFEDDGIRKVVWITVNDEVRCSECKKRHNKVYDITDVPPKPHPNCRCILLPYIEDEGEKV